MVMMLPITINVLTFYSDSNVKEHLRHLHFPQICAHKIHGHLWIKNQKMGQITSSSTSECNFNEAKQRFNFIIKQ